MKIPLQIVLVICAITSSQAQLLCTSVSHSTGNLSPISCQCEVNYWWDGLNCQIDCSIVTGSTGKALSLSTCQCNSGLTWTGTSCANQSTSILNCSRFAYATTSNGQGGCNCITGYFWLTNQCISGNAGINCSALQYTNGKDGIYSCRCLPTFKWDGIQCQLNCSAVSGSTGVNVGTYVCRCTNGKISLNMSCGVNCSTISNANGSNGTSACKCNTGYIWLNQACVSTLNCSNVSHATGLNGSKCNCERYYVWVSSNSTCTHLCSLNGVPAVLNVTCYLCRDLYYTVTYQTYGILGINDCGCIQGFYWEPEYNQCIIDCSNITYSSGPTNQINSC